MTSLLGSLADGLAITNYDDWLIFTQRLENLLHDDKIKRIPALPSNHFAPGDEWYLDPETGEIYVHGIPNAPTLPTWEKFDIVAHTQEPPPHPNDLSVIPAGEKSALEAKGLKGFMDFLIVQGVVEAIPPSCHYAPADSTEEWFKERGTGKIYRLVRSSDGERNRWERVPDNKLRITLH